MLFIAFFLTWLIFICGFFMVSSKNSHSIDERISTYLEVDQMENELDKNGKMKLIEVIGKGIKTIWTAVARLFKRRMHNGKVEILELKLLKAGSPLNMSPFDYRVFQVVSPIMFTLFYGLFAFLLGLSDAQILLFVLIGLGFGAFIPNVYFNGKIKRRKSRALRELPDFVDLLAVSLEAGLGFDSALSKVIARQSGVLTEEFRRCLDEVRLGKTRKEGLSGIKKRLDIEEISTLINSIIRAEKLGVGMVQVLRVQSSEIREKRKQRAEEQAMKTPIKILFPLVLFIFPSLFIIILGPAAIKIIDAFR